MKLKLHNVEHAVIAARAVLSDVESISDHAVLRAAGESLFYAASAGDEPAILVGMLKAAEDSGSEKMVRILRRAIGTGHTNDVLVDPNDATELVNLLRDCDQVVKGREAEALGRAACATAADGHRRSFVRGILDQANRDADDLTARAMRAALAVFDEASEQEAKEGPALTASR